MVEETIQTIKETELEAEELVKNADIQCTGILEEASKRAEQLKVETAAGAQEKAQANIQSAKEAGDKKMEEALADVEKEIASLKNTSTQKEEDAITAVIAELV